jgi:cation transport ATPase
MVHPRSWRLAEIARTAVLMIAGAAMAFSSVTVVSNALLLRRGHPARAAQGGASS